MQVVTRLRKCMELLPPDNRVLPRLAGMNVVGTHREHAGRYMTRYATGWELMGLLSGISWNVFIKDMELNWLGGTIK